MIKQMNILILSYKKNKLFMMNILIILIPLNIKCSSQLSENKKQSAIEVYSQSINDTTNYRFNNIKKGFKTPEDLAKSLIKSLQYYDETSYLRHIIPIEEKLELYKMNLQYNVINEDSVKYLDSISKSDISRKLNFIKRAKYFLEIILEDKKIDINKIDIIDITKELKSEYLYDYTGDKMVAPFAIINVKIEFNHEYFYIEIPQVVKVKDRWYLNYPEYYIRDKSEYEFLKNYRDH